MEEWYSKVRQLKDESEDRALTRQICESIYHYLKRTKIKEKTKFKERMGPEFDKFIGTFADKYPESTFYNIISNDDFWDYTLKLMIGV